MFKSIRHHLIFLIHIIAIIYTSNLSYAQCGTDIDLSTWITEGNPANGNWVVSGPNGNTVTQSINGEPTFFVSPDEFINVQINGKFYVDNAAWDDDFIGFVFGYQNPTSPVVNDCDFYIFDWKASTQVVNGQTGNEGFSLGKVDGTFNWNGTGTFYPTFWGRNANNNYTPIATQYGNNEGWNAGIEYEFSLIYTTTTITIIVAGDTIFDEQGCFPPGRFGFYNLSQDYSSYYDFSYQVIADIDASATQSCSNDSIDFVSINNNCLTSGFTAAQITSWQWDFGDGTTSSDTNYRHAYDSAGTYTVTLIVEDDLNCIDTATMDIEVFPLPSNFLGNDTSVCEGNVATFQSLNTYNSYDWSDGSSGNQTTTTTPGNYWLNVVDANMCTGSDTINLSNFPLPQFSIGTNDTICTTDSLSITSNNSYSSYLWNTAENTQGITINTPGTYQLTVTDSNACSAADTFELFNYPVAVTNLGNDITICPDDSASITPGNNYTSFNWNTNETSSSISINSIGNYWVETIDLNGCPSSDTLVLDTFVLPYFSLRNDTAICDQYVLAVDGGNNFSNYAWSTSESTQNINVTSAGLYALTVTDNNNCSQVDSFDLTVFPLPQFSIGTNDTICTTDSLTIASNNSYSSYLWNTAENTQGITINTPGTYQLTVTDSNACSAADTFELFNYPVASTNLGNNVTVCPGDYATISPGNNYQSYNWKNGYSTNSISVNTIGNYWVETIDVNGCPSADTVVVNNFTVPALNLGNDTNICLQSFDTINLDATNSFVQFQWNDGSTSQNYLVTQQGSYAVTTTDQNGCTTSDAIQIGAYPQTTFAVNDDTVCVGNSASLNISGSGLVSYTWSNGGTSSSINTTQTGNYFITVSDTNNCEAYGSSSVRNHPQTTPYIGVDDTLCMRDIKFLDAGAVYTSYQWSTGETTQNVSIDTSGTYWVEVQDTNGCFGRDSINLTFNYGPTLILGTDTSICSGDSLMLNGGQAISYLWNTGETTQNISVGSAGIYAVTTTDQNTCTSIDSFQLSIYNLPTVDLGSPIYYCEGTSFNQPLDAGSGYSSYSWMNGGSAQVLMLNETMSTVWVEVTDANTCSNSDTMFIIEDPKPYINLGSNDTACSAQITTLNSGNNTGGVTSYLWSTNQTSPSITFQTPINVTNPVTSSYSLTVTDTNACINSDTITLTTLPLPNPDLGPDTAYCYGSSFSTVLNPGQFSAYNWNTGNSSQTINIGAFDSVYSVTVTDANGCQNSDYIIVSEYALPNPDLGNDIYYCEGTNFSTTLDPGNFNEYYWDSGKSLPYHLVTGAGNYHVTVTDVNGCENSDSISIFMSSKPIVDLGNDITMCEDSVFMMTFDASTYLSQNQYNFQWNTGSTNPTVLITDFGSYSVTVTESNSGCMDSSSVSLLPFNLIEVSLGNDTIICDGSRQLIEANVSGGSGYSYLWSTGATTTSINIYEPGEYWVELNSNNNTCGGVRDTINYELAFAPDVELGDDIEACIGEEVYLVNQLASNEYTEYDWDFMGIGDSMLVTYDGFYEVTASNACGTAVDRISVIFMDCFQVYIPNAFTPNGDNLNDIFKPETDQPLEEYEFLVFDRWGNQVFKSTEISLGWDGTYHGEIAADGIYMWKISYVSGYDSKRKFKEEIGQVNLIK